MRIHTAQSEAHTPPEPNVDLPMKLICQKRAHSGGCFIDFTKSAMLRGMDTSSIFK
jgi:hypothetical protein